MINSNFVSIVLAGTNNNRLTNALNLQLEGEDVPDDSKWTSSLAKTLTRATTATTTANIKDSGTYLIFGNGNTPNNDYSLSSEITSGLTCNTMTRAFTKSGIIYTSTITNDSSNPITITEIGLCEDCLGGYNNYGQAILGREEIEPITLQPGDTKSFTYKINLSVEE